MYCTCTCETLRQHLAVNLAHKGVARPYIRLFLVEYIGVCVGDLTRRFCFIWDDTTDEVRGGTSERRHQVVQLLLRTTAVMVNKQGQERREHQKVA